MQTHIFVSIILAALSLTLGYALGGFWLETILSLALGLVWLVGQWRGWRRVDSLALFALVTLAALGAWQGASAGWLLFGLVAALVAWDLAHFERRLGQATHIKAETALRRGHLQRLFSIVGMGYLLGLLALSFEIELNLGWAIFFGMLIIIGLGRLIGAIRREERV